MTKGNLYYYFRNKEEILFACHDYSLDMLLALMAEVQAEPSPPDDKLRRLMLAFIHMILDELQGTALTLDLQALSPPLLKRVIAKRDRFDHGMREIIQQGIDQGLFTPGDPKMIGFAMMGAVNWITKWFDPAGPMTSEQIGEAFADYLVGGLTSKTSHDRSHDSIARLDLLLVRCLRSRLQFQHLDAGSGQVLLRAAPACRSAAGTCPSASARPASRRATSRPSPRCPGPS